MRFLLTDPIGLVNLADFPGGLSAQQTEKFLRENGPRTFVFKRAAVIWRGDTTMTTRNVSRQIERLEARLLPASEERVLIRL